MQAIVITAGKGTRLWPFTEIRSKSMLTVSNMSIVHWFQQALTAAGLNDFDIELLVATGLEEQVMELIINSGNARSSAYEALSFDKQGNILRAE